MSAPAAGLARILAVPPPGPGASGEPRWLAERRSRARAALERAELPTEAEEDWRYSRIGELDQQGFLEQTGVVPIGSPAELDQVVDALRAASGVAGVVRTLDGRIVGVELGAQAAGLGVEVVGAASLEEAPDQLGELVAPRADAFTLLADAAGADVVAVFLPAGLQLGAPLVVLHELSAGGVAFPRTLVLAGEHSAASIVEVVASGPGRRLVVPVVELSVGAGAELAYSSIQQLGAETWQIGYRASRLGAGASLHSFSAALGGDYARQLDQCVLAGERSRSELLAVYLGRGHQVQDLRTFQEHASARTRSELVFKGAVADEARAVYTGLIRMRRGAVKADAAQTNRNLVLSKGAHADSVPNLEIEENDVRCSHASAVGPIDPDQLFYLGSRGVPPEAAERLIVLGFFDDLFSRAAEAGVGAYLRGAVAARVTGAAPLPAPSAA